MGPNTGISAARCTSQATRYSTCRSICRYCSQSPFGGVRANVRTIRVCADDVVSYRPGWGAAEPITNSNGPGSRPSSDLSRSRTMGLGPGVTTPARQLFADDVVPLLSIDPCLSPLLSDLFSHATASISQHPLRPRSQDWIGWRCGSISLQLGPQPLAAPSGGNSWSPNSPRSGGNALAESSGTAPSPEATIA